MGVNARASALSRIARCVHELEYGNGAGPQEQNARTTAVVRLSLYLVVALLISFAWALGVAVKVLIGFSILLSLTDWIGTSVWLHYKAHKTEAFGTWEAELRHALRQWKAVDGTTKSNLNAWASETPLPLAQVKAWLAQEKSML